MNKKIIALLLGVIMILCQGTLCLGEGLSANQEQPAPLVYDFEEDGNLSGITSASAARLQLSVENGNLKCVSTLINYSSHMYLPLENIDGEYYNRFKIIAKVEDACDLPASQRYSFALYYQGTDKTTGSAYGEAEARATRGYFTNLTENEGKFSNDGYEEYVIDLSTIGSWSDSTISKLRIDPMKNSSGILYIDKIEIYHEEEIPEPTTEPTVEPTAQPTAQPTTAPTAEPTEVPTEAPTQEPPAEDEGVLEYSFDSDVEGFVKKDGNVTLTAEDGMLKYVSVATVDGNGKSSSGNMVKDVSYGIGQYCRLEMKVKLDGVLPTFNGGNGAPNMTMNYSGTDADGNSYGISSARQTSRKYQATLNADDGKYYSDWQIIEIDFSELASWDICNVNKIRFDIIKNAEGTIYIDYIKFFTQPKAPEPTEEPTIAPTAEPTAAPTTAPSESPSASEVPSEEPPVAPSEEPPAAEGEEALVYNFDNSTEGFAGKDGDVTLTAEGGLLKYVSKAKYDSSNKAYSGNMTKDVNYGIGQYYKLEMRVKLAGVLPTFNGGNGAPNMTMNYSGKDANGVAYGISSARQTSYNYEATLNTEDGKYYSDWQTVVIDFADLEKDGSTWAICNIDKIRLDIIKNAEGTIYIDYIKLVSVPAVTDMSFDGKADIENAVPVGTKTITATLSSGIYSVDKSAVSITDADGVKVPIESVSYDDTTNAVTVKVEELDTITDYTLTINTNAMANKKQKLYKAIQASFKTEAGELEYSATGDANSAVMSFANKAIAPKTVRLIATVWSGDEYVGKVTQKYSIASGESTYTFDYSGAIGGDRVEVAVWDYDRGVVKKVYGKKVYKFNR